MTVLENLLTGRHARIKTNMLAEMFFLPGVRRQELEHREAAEKIMSFFGLTPQRHTLVGELPFGRQKLVGVARALAIDPVLLLLDEPSAGLNRNEREDLARFIIRIKAQLGLPMIWIEHDMQMVADLADRLHVLDYGKTLAIGSAQQVLRDPAVVEAYLGTHGVVLHGTS
jgi:branched-chain amino acid transport system ATP-binding protein